MALRGACGSRPTSISHNATVGEGTGIEKSPRPPAYALTFEKPAWHMRCDRSVTVYSFRCNPVGVSSKYPEISVGP